MGGGPLSLGGPMSHELKPTFAWSAKVEVFYNRKPCINKQQFQAILSQFSHIIIFTFWTKQKIIIIIIINSTYIVLFLEIQ